MSLAVAPPVQKASLASLAVGFQALLVSGLPRVPVLSLQIAKSSSDAHWDACVLLAYWLGKRKILNHQCHIWLPAYTMDQCPSVLL